MQARVGGGTERRVVSVVLMSLHHGALAVFEDQLGVKSDAHFQAALVLAERTFDKAWGQEEAKAAALAERQALELELQVAER